MKRFDIVAETNEDTVIADYEPVKGRSDSFQTEAELEAEFIRMLCEQGYIYLKIHGEKDLKANLRRQLEALNNYVFRDSEWERFYSEVIDNANDGMTEKTAKIQENNIHALKRTDGTTKNIKLIDRENIYSNILQVINQYTAKSEKATKRYDVTILVNGFPLVHVELKRRGTAIKKAFNQINNYREESFTGLFDYVQIFVISNGTETKYYSNTTRINAGKVKNIEPGGNFDFTSYWADGKNKSIMDLVDFTRTFFAKHTILNVLTKYCIFTSESKLMVMRPYQITAAERIINKIKIANNYKIYGTKDSGGYIWHTTGAGKTLTSFKTARIASGLGFIDKVLFVVDRKDLDYQTMKEYDKFQKGAANGNKSTAVLQKQLSDPEARIIVTTIQKLSNFIKQNKTHAVYNKHVVIIFDECHRSQFGEMHRAITRNFRKYYIFGFTGTPIFGNEAAYGIYTTKQTFGVLLHAYTIVDAIRDKNVLPFRVDYLNSMDKKENISDERVQDIDREKAFNAAPRITEITKYIIEHFNQKTSHKFNSILAVSSIKAAKLYYDEFRKIDQHGLKVAVIFSSSSDDNKADGILQEENSESTSQLDIQERNFLSEAINDYNKMFSTNYDISNDKFQNYYKSVSQHMKEKELDLLIVVNMFLTGFDAPELNTLWVDKNLKMHGLIQAFSRTNRIFDDVKKFGNIICFRNLKTNVDEALVQFGDDEKKSVALVRTFNEYYNGYEDNEGKKVRGYVSIIEDLTKKFPLGVQITGEQNEKDFISLFSLVLRMTNILKSFDEFEGKEIITIRDFQDYKSRYLDLYDKYRSTREMSDINGDIVFELELIGQDEINIDYILIQLEKYHAAQCMDKEILITLKKAIDSSPEFRSKRELIETFIAKINKVSDVISEWIQHIRQQRENDIQTIITEENLKPEPAREFLENALKFGEVKTTGTDINNFMSPLSMFERNREEKKQRIITRFQKFVEKYSGV